MSGLKIEIDDYEFILEKRSNFDERNFVVYKSKKRNTNDPYKHFVTYKSMSEGFWRFFKLFREHRGQYFKCKEDYVTCTFLHFSLQCFINNNYIKLPQISEEETKNYLNEDTFYTKDILGNRLYKDDYSILIFSIEDFFPKIVKTFFFDSFNLELIKSFVSFENKLELSENVISLNYNINFDNYQYLKVYLNYLLELQEETFKKLKEEKGEELFETIKNKLIKQTTDRFNNGIITQERYNSNLENINKSTVENLVTPHMEPEYYKLVRTYKILSDYFETFFEVDTKVQEYICTLNIELSDIQNIEQTKIVVNFPFHIFKTKIKNKCEDKIYDLYYACYNYEKREYKIISNILPENEKINETGLYERYISIPPYIYKMFEYNIQCTVEKECIGIQYKFIGDFQTNVFPLTQLQFQIPSQGGKRKTRKNKKKYNR